MIVKNKELTISKADEIAKELLIKISEEAKKFGCEDDPAEHIYFLTHVAGSFLAKIIYSLEGFGKIYAIPNFDIQTASNWILKIADEHLSVFNVKN